jgi:hypothetical protein
MKKKMKSFVEKVMAEKNTAESVAQVSCFINKLTLD